MKSIKKIIALIIAVILTLSVFSLTAYAQEQDTKALKFNNGKFKILVLADIQDTDKPQKATVELVNNAIDKTQPDLVIMTGDNTAGWWKNVDKEKTEQAIDNVAKAIDDRGIPFALVFGNHDHEGLCDDKNGMEEEEAKELMLSWYQKYESCLAVEGEEMTGVGNYNLTVKDSVGEKDIFNLWLIDSNPYTDENEGGGYGYVHPDQIEWYENKSNELKEANAGKPLPSIVFQHIVVPEVYDMLKEVPKETDGAVRGNANKTEKYYVTNPEFIYQGSLREGPCPANTANAGQFDSWVKQGDVIGAFFGHDHINDFAGAYKGIKLVAVPGVTSYSYGDNRGVRTITLDESNLQDFETEILTYDDLVDYEIKNPYVAKHGYSAYINSFLPTVFGVIGGVAGLAIIAVIVVLIVKKRK